MPGDISKMQWIYDSRGHSFVPKFKIGSIVSVSDVHHSNISHSGEEMSSGSERYQFLGMSYLSIYLSIYLSNSLIIYRYCKR
jgi:hypothetical protein